MSSDRRSEAPLQVLTFFEPSVVHHRRRNGDANQEPLSVSLAEYFELEVYRQSERNRLLTEMIGCDI